MGELIRNIKEIRLGGETLMVEENEGYSKNQGRLIHIQNSKFRYLMTEKAYLQLLATILRAKEEKDYYKSTYPRVTEEERLRVFANPSEETGRLQRRFASLLESAGVRYRFVESGGWFVTFLINNEDAGAFHRAVGKVRDLKKRKHVFGKAMGYEFLYQMRPFELYQYRDLFVEIYFQLPCMSLTPKTWIPLDRHLQTRAWEESSRREGLTALDDVTYYIYRLCWAVFRRGFFSDHDKALLTRFAPALEDPAMPSLLDVVFFGFAPRLTELLRAGEYDAVIPEYYAFDQY